MKKIVILIILVIVLLFFWFVPIIKTFVGHNCGINWSANKGDCNFYFNITLKDFLLSKMK